MADLLKRLDDYQRSPAYPFHMPGHKRNIPKEAADLYDTYATYPLINGSSCGIQEVPIAPALPLHLSK